MRRSFLNKVIKLAVDLGIKLTSAEIESEIYECWADRVLLAAMLFDRGDMEQCQKVIDDANRYAI
jgi:hypothetical protein